MKNLWFILPALCFLSVSCEKSSPEVVKNEPEKELKCIVSYAPVFTWKGPALYKFIYNQDSILTNLLKVVDDDTAVTVPAYTFTYNDFGKLVKVEEDYEFGGYYNFQYNDKVTKVEYYGFEGNQNIKLLYKYVIAYDADNKPDMKTVYYGDGVLLSKIFYEYDDRENLNKILDSNYHNNKYTLEYIAQFYYSTKPSNNFHHLLKPDLGFLGYQSPNEMEGEIQLHLVGSDTLRTQKLYSYAYANDGKPDALIHIIDDPSNYFNKGYSYYYKCE